MARILSISTDLLLGSKVDAMLKAAGHDVTTSPSIQEADLEGIELAVADLDVGSAEALIGFGFPVLGYYSHVDVETRQAAEAAGVDLVVPRSRMARELPDLVDRLLGG
ncbi:MAG TPA: hypothetical protein VK889_05140 [Solirubrobacterales bacterium]|nr:hypothetical protein [Solirubrobacterales bacterium]